MAMLWPGPSGTVHMRGVAQREGRVMPPRIRPACEVHRVVLVAAAQDDEAALDPVGHSEAERLLVEGDGGRIGGVAGVNSGLP